MESSLSVVVVDKRGEEEKRTIIPHDALNQKKFNCDEQGNPVNKNVLDLLGVKYECP